MGKQKTDEDFKENTKIVEIVQNNTKKELHVKKYIDENNYSISINEDKIVSYITPKKTNEMFDNIVKELKQFSKSDLKRLDKTFKIENNRNIRYIVEGITYSILYYIFAQTEYVIKFIWFFVPVLFMALIILVVGVFKNEALKRELARFSIFDEVIYLDSEVSNYKRIRGTKFNDFVWRIYIKYRYNYLFHNHQDLLIRCLEREKEDACNSSDFMKTIILPSELAIVSCLPNIIENKAMLIWAVLIGTLFIMLILGIEVVHFNMKSMMIGDFMKVLKDIEEDKQKQNEEIDAQNN